MNSAKSGYTNQYFYDEADNLSEILYPDGYTVLYEYDKNDNITKLTDRDGRATTYEYDPLNRLIHVIRADFYGYNAESYNPNTGLEFLRARYYNANPGRFFQEDTYLGDITDPLTLNRYAYVKNSPLNYVDPSGHRTYWDCGYPHGDPYPGGHAPPDGRKDLLCDRAPSFYDPRS